MEVKILENSRFSLFLRLPSILRHQKLYCLFTSRGRNRAPTGPRRAQNEEYTSVSATKFCIYFAFTYICTMSRTLRGTHLVGKG